MKEEQKATPLAPAAEIADPQARQNQLVLERRACLKLRKRLQLQELERMFALVDDRSAQ
jgi:hypothetical protein